MGYFSGWVPEIFSKLEPGDLDMCKNDAFNKNVNILAAGCNPCKSGANCNCNTICRSCACGSRPDNKCQCFKKSEEKPRSSSAQDDGVLCRKCNTFLSMAEPDDKNDGKTVCYDCANPW